MLIRIEMYLAVIAGCIPAVKALVSQRINKKSENAVGLSENSLWAKFRLKSFSSGIGTLESQIENMGTHHPFFNNRVLDPSELSEVQSSINTHTQEVHQLRGTMRV